MDSYNIQIVDNFFAPFIYRDLYSMFLVEADANWAYNPNVTFVSLYGSLHKIAMEFLQNNPIMEPDAFINKVSPDHKNYQKISNYFTKASKEKFDVILTNLMRLHTVFYPTNSNFKPDHFATPHVDWFKPHTSILYYLNDCDADTFFFDAKINTMEDYSNASTRKLNIIKRVTPKKNRAVLFDGSILHSASASTKFKRVTVNLNFVQNT